MLNSLLSLFVLIAANSLYKPLWLRWTLNQASGAVDAPVREVKGAAATEFVIRWLRRNLPIALPALKALELVACRGSRQRGGGGDVKRARLLAGRAMVDSVAETSAVAVVSRSMGQSM